MAFVHQSILGATCIQDHAVAPASDVPAAESSCAFHTPQHLGCDWHSRLCSSSASPMLFSCKLSTLLPGSGTSGLIARFIAATDLIPCGHESILHAAYLKGCAVSQEVKLHSGVSTAAISAPLKCPFPAESTAGTGPYVDQPSALNRYIYCLTCLYPRQNADARDLPCLWLGTKPYLRRVLGPQSPLLGEGTECSSAQCCQLQHHKR